MCRKENVVKQVVLVWGGWSCTAGYTYWAYVAEFVPDQPANMERPGCEKIGTRLFDAPHREEITDPKNDKYHDVPAAHPKPVCRAWINKKGYKLVDETEMRTD